MQLKKNEKSVFIPRTSINVNTEFWSREKLDGVVVSSYARSMRAGDTFPPVLVDKRTMCVIDGFLRMEAYRRSGIEIVTAVIREYSNVGEMLADAARENSRHGSSLSTYEKTALAIRLKAEFHLDLSNIADILSEAPATIEDYLARRTVYVEQNDGTVDLKAVKKPVADYIDGITTPTAPISQKRYEELSVRCDGYMTINHMNQTAQRLRNIPIDPKDSNLILAFWDLFDAMKLVSQKIPSRAMVTRALSAKPRAKKAAKTKSQSTRRKAS